MMVPDPLGVISPPHQQQRGGIIPLEEVLLRLSKVEDQLGRILFWVKTEVGKDLAQMWDPDVYICKDERDIAIEKQTKVTSNKYNQNVRSPSSTPLDSVDDAGLNEVLMKEEEASDNDEGDLWIPDFSVGPIGSTTKHTTCPQLQIEDETSTNGEINIETSTNGDINIETSTNGTIKLEMSNPSQITKTAEQAPPNKSNLSRITCEICECSLSSKKTYYNHKKVVHSSFCRRHLCPICSKVYKSASSLKVHHRMAHLKLKPFACSVCGASFGYRFSLTTHMHCHSEKPNFPCDHCGEEFRHVQSLYRHKKRHHFGNLNKVQLKQSSDTKITPSKNRPSDSFTFSSLPTPTVQSYNDHNQKTLNKQILHQCQICPKIYKNASSLKDHHMKVHLKLKPFACSICGASFGHRFSLTTHMHCHSEKPNFPCDHCGEEFRHAQSLYRHKKRHH